MDLRKTMLVALLATGIHGAKAQGSGFGLGLIVGEPTGISFKGWLANDRAFAGAVAWRFWGGRAFHIHGDYLFHNRTLIGVPRGSLPLYYGVGARVRTWHGGHYYRWGRRYEYVGSRLDLGIRFPVGLSYEFDGAPLDVFLEVVPTLDLIPGTAFDLGAGLGLRYYF
jgi:hypothetical protein